MKKHLQLFVALTLLVGAATQLNAQVTAFTYQGRLTENGAPATGANDFTFTLCDAGSGSATVGASNVVNDLAVSNGLFTVTLDFGAAVFDGNARWLEIAVRPGASAGAYTNLIPRQPITSTPYALRALNAGNANTAAGVSAGAVNNLALAADAVDGAKILNSSITSEDLNPSLLTGTFWNLGGNAGTTPGAQFLGTSDNQPLEFKVNNQRGLRLEPTGFLDRVNVIGGAARNSVAAGVGGATIGGGGAGDYGGNTLAADFGTVSGGLANNIGVASQSATIGGGLENTIHPGAIYATIGGGTQNSILTSAARATIGGGDQNKAGGNYATVPGGVDNTAGGQFSFAAGHDANALHDGTFVWADSPAGGFSSTGNNQFLIRAGGGVGINNNNPNGAALAVNGNVTVNGTIGTPGNQPLELKVNNQRGLRLEPTTSADTINVIGGSARNSVAAGVVGATIGGGGSGGDFGGFGPYTNRVEADFGTVSGGAQNTIQPNASSATIGGGFANTIESNARTTTIGGGFQNRIQPNASYATISGGNLNTTGGQYATVPGGAGNTAGGQFSFAAGHDATALHDGAFVWADSLAGAFSSTGSNQFCVRARGGIQLDPLTSQYFGSQTRQMLNLYGTSYGLGVQASSLYFRCDSAAGTDGFIWYKGGVHDDGYAQPGAGGSELMHLVQGALYVNGALVPSSDRNAKENFAPVQQRAVLEKVVALPLSSWNYKADTATRHLGFMAQDFYAAFNIGPDDKHIATVDADGVALAAIQGLNQKLEAGSQKSEDRIQKLETENAELKQRLEKLEQLMNQNNRGAQ